MDEALAATVQRVSLKEIDTELNELVPQESLKAVAACGLRGELAFLVPCLLEANPFLIGYYRLFLGYSKKEFYSPQFGLTSFHALEERGTIPLSCAPRLQEFSKAMIFSACLLIESIGIGRLNRNLIHDLTLLTLGPQLRGGANVSRGTEVTDQVFEIIKEIVLRNGGKAGKREIIFQNASGRAVKIQFASDPDIIIQEFMPSGAPINKIAIEVKGGKDFSNIHNRLGEAEKSHQKAHKQGYHECWTVVNVDRMDEALAKRESPSTNRFYLFSQLEQRHGLIYEDFVQRIKSLAGII